MVQDKINSFNAAFVDLAAAYVRKYTAGHTAGINWKNGSSGRGRKSATSTLTKYGA